MPAHLRFLSIRIVVLVGVLSGISVIPLRAADDIRYIDPSDTNGSSAAVVVPDVPLMHTVQILPLDDAGQRVIGKGEADVQISHVVRKLESVLDIGLGVGGPPQFVKINVVAASDEVAKQVRDKLSATFKGRASKPAVSYVVGKLRHPDALVAMDAVAVHSLAVKLKSQRRFDLGGPEAQAHLSVLPAGPKFYVSGQAEKGKDIAEMTRRTMESLAATLKQVGLDLDDVVQVKSFIGPMTAVADAEREIASFFKGGSDVPPLVFVEWTTEPSIEIELIAGREQGTGPVGDSVEFITPPGMQASPVFSRVAHVAAGPTIYVSGLYGDSQANGEAEIREIFAHLGKLLDKSGSDFRHLAKATYYVSTNEASVKLGTIRPEFYDPKRPPAASKAPVTGTGREGRTITLDMIAVPRPK
jgi:enamine deaminase RidA (YjgF/YER057c/UK114 family)